MESNTNCPHGHSPEEAISPAAANQAIAQFVTAASKYIGNKYNTFAVDCLKDAADKHDIAKAKIELLSSTSDKLIARYATTCEEMRVEFWGYIREPVGRLRALQAESARQKNTGGKGDSKSVADQEDGSGNMKPISSMPGDSITKSTEGINEPPKPTESRLVYDAKVAIAKYRRGCKEEIRELDIGGPLWAVADKGKDRIDFEYKKTREIVKDIISAADTEAREGEMTEQDQAKKLLERLRKIWKDARHYFRDVAPDDKRGPISGMDEEYKLGLLF
ncbi:hypothetical protein F5Y19DRAFT_471533 [Xylariaceae sp. FL1651]|nr:hypothetical protein F5Y19DRAFT_471533 [Xylariaceae sp. FL1651]